MTQATVLVTGTTDGIGKATALALARQNFHVILHGRNAQKVEKTRQEILLQEPQASLDTVTADFASLGQVKEMAANLLTRIQTLDVLINNAGVFMQERKLSQDGYELTFAVNHLAPMALTLALLPLLRASRARVVNVSSYAHRRGDFDFNDLDFAHGFEGYRAYARSKLANIYFSNELAERERGGLTSNSLHPGGVTTKLLQTGFGITGITPAQGAETSVYLATSPDVELTTGKYFSESREMPTMPPLLSLETQKKLWEVSLERIGKV